MMQYEQLDEFSFVLDNRQTDEWIGLRRAQQRRRKHDGHVLGAHHVLLLVLRHSVVDTYTNDIQITTDARLTGRRLAKNLISWR